MGRTGSEISGVIAVEPKGLKRLWRLLIRTFIVAFEDNCFGIAKGAAYSALLAFFPVLASLAAILVQVRAEAVAHLIAQFLVGIVPPGSEELVQYEFAIRGQRPAWLIGLAAMLSLWGASGAMISLMEGFQAAYRLPSGRPFLKQRLVAILMTFTLAIPALGASFLILFGARLEPVFYERLGFAVEGEQIRIGVRILGSLARYLIALGTVVLVTGLLYYFGPNTSIKLRKVWPGALIATFFWGLNTGGFAWYVRNIANYNVMYGSIGAVIALVVWMYLMAVIALLGCEFNAERERQSIQ
jgi:membrane protein